MIRSNLVISLIFTASIVASDEPTINFARDVQPILSRKCFVCHGPDEGNRKADLRLDIRETAIEFESIVPGKPEESELVRRIFSTDADERMPPADSHETLTDDQKETLKKWIHQGAPYTRHWAFVPPKRPALPQLANDDWSENAIDKFIFRKLREKQLAPATRADRYTLVRRLYLDLIGLPPTIEQADAFMNDTRPDAWPRLVDSLLASPEYGQFWARRWLDLARYSDTNGYEKDRQRSIWPYRDWVIRALNEDMPYDRFTIEQLAGDMLPHATQSQRVATGFHRNTMLNEEGGIDPNEYRFHAMVDRVATTGTVWLGLSTGCAQCHSHKYDPISHTDYYRLMALMNNAAEPDLKVQSPELIARWKEIESQIASLENDLADQLPDWETKFNAWLVQQQKTAGRWNVITPSSATTNLPKLTVQKNGAILSTGDVTKRDVFKLQFVIDEDLLPVTALRIEAMRDERLPAGGPGRAFYEGRKGDFFLSELKVSTDSPIELHSATASNAAMKAAAVYDGEGSSGWSLTNSTTDEQLVVQLKKPITKPTELVVEMIFERHYAASLGLFRVATSSSGNAQASKLPVELEASLLRESKDRSDRETQSLQRYFLLHTPELAEARKPIDALRNKLPEFPHTLVLQERPADNRRVTHRHHRGEYLSPKEEITAMLPDLFRNQEAAPNVANRLQFARWLVSDQNPLAARVAVNRAWRSFFGRGIVKTSGDFGVQSEPPSHPELLDYLAAEFTENGWSPKHIHRLIVTSATYRQQSAAATKDYLRDPDNEWLSRGPRFRLQAEIIRDSALQASGMLARKMYGPSVFPPQPPSVTALAYGGMKWQVSNGADRYRRSLYTFNKRTAPFADYSLFDAPSGEFCVARRNRSNTPLQALVLLNDQLFLELAQALVTNRLTDTGEDSFDKNATLLFRSVLTRPPSDEELALIREFYDKQTRRLNNSELDAKLISPNDPTPATASWVMTARTLLNLDEAITKP